MAEKRFTIGLDFGTESGRVMLVDAATGEEAAYSVVEYRHGVMDKRLPDGTPLEPEWALQDPADYIEVLRKGIPTVLRLGGVGARQVAGVGVDFTSCTVLPTLRDGTPLSTIPTYSHNPHAWVKLWKHHAAQPEADRINATGGELLDVFGGRYSSEWLVSKALQMVDEAPEIYNAADRIIEAGDWIVWQMTGVETRSECAAGYKGMWVKGHGWPPREFFRELNPRLEYLVRDKLAERYLPLGSVAGRLTERMARETGLDPGTPIATAVIDAHAAVPACGVVKPGAMVMIMGTSLCHMLLGEERRLVEGVAGVIEDGILPGYWGYEAGQAAVGDSFSWCFRAFNVKAEEMTERASRLRAGQTGLLALDWWNGNRSVLMNANLSGLLVGATLNTEPHEIYRAVIEATAFGTAAVIEAFERKGISIGRLVGCGGLPQKSPLVMQIFADVTNRTIQLPRSLQASGLGAAMHAAVAAGVYPTFEDAANAMAGLQPKVYEPDPAAHAVYSRLYEHYRKLHDHFGRGADDVMTRLREIRHAARA